MKVLVLGATGLLGSAVLRCLHGTNDLEVVGTVRDTSLRTRFPEDHRERLVETPDLASCDGVARVLDEVGPDVLVNCVSAPRNAIRSGELPRLLPLLSVLPQRLARLSAAFGIRLLQVGSDGVFTGTRGGYTEADCPNATDAYGIAKILGEVDGPGAVTIRTSLIGHEIGGGHALLEWFLARSEACNVHIRYVFSPLTTVELARVIREHILPRPELSGIYHIAGRPISKADLLEVISQVYGKKVDLVPDDSVCVDRTLVADRFRQATGYTPPPWPELIQEMEQEWRGFRRP